MGAALNRIIKRSLQNEYRRQTNRRSGTARLPTAAVVSGASVVNVGGQAVAAAGIDAPKGSIVAVQNVGRPANAIYAPAKGASVYAVGVASLGGSGGGGGGGTIYTAGNGISIISDMISFKPTSTGGLIADTTGASILLPTNSGLLKDATGLRVDPGDGLDLLSNKLVVDVSDLLSPNGGLEDDGLNNLRVKMPTNSGLTRDGNGIALAIGDQLAWNSVDQVTATGHTHSLRTSSDTGIDPLDYILHTDTNGRLGLAQLTLRGNLVFAGGHRTITASNNLTIAPTGNLLITPPNPIAPALPQVLYLKDSMEARSTTAQDTIGGIFGWDLFDNNRPANTMQLNINTLKADNIFVRKFQADELRVARGDWFLTRSFGVVETDFITPALNNDVEVWFEEAPGLNDGEQLFLTGNWIQFRVIDLDGGMPALLTWYKVVDGQPLNPSIHYIQRQDQTADDDPNPHVARQQWRLKRMSQGVTGARVKKGETGADFGQPAHMDGATPIPDQGIIWATSLYENRGPFIQTQLFTSVVSNVPQFKLKTRMGNLNGTVNYSADVYGFAAGNDLSIIPETGFSGITVDANSGLKLYNNDIALYTGADLFVELHRNRGLNFKQDTGSLATAKLDISWWSDITNQVAANRRSSIQGYETGTGSSNPVSVTEIMTQTPTSGVNITSSIQLNTYGFGGKQAHLYLSTDAYNTKIGNPPTVWDGTWAILIADQVELYSKAVVTSDTDREAMDAVFTVREKTSNINQYAGATILQKGLGDAVLHWHFANDDGSTLVHGEYYSAGIDNDDGNKFKISNSHSLQVATFLTFDPATGTVTLNGLDVGGSTPPSGLIAGDGIALAGSVISVKTDVARTNMLVNAGAGLSGGGTIGSNPTINIDLASSSGLEIVGDKLGIQNALAGAGLTMAAGKVMTVATSLAGAGLTWISTGVLGVNYSQVVPTTVPINTSNPLMGGGPLGTGLTLGLRLAPQSNLEVDVVTGGLRVSDVIAGNGLVMNPVTRALDLEDPSGGGGGYVVDIIPHAPLSGGGPTDADVNLYLDLDTTLPGLIVNAGAGRGLNVDWTKVVGTGVQVLAGSGLSGGGALTGNVTLSLNPAAVVSPSTQVIAGTGLLGGGPLTGNVTLSLNPASVVSPSVQIIAGNGLTGGGALTANVTIDVNPGSGIALGSGADTDKVIVNQAFAFAWTGAQTWGALVTQTFNGNVIFNKDTTFANTGVHTFNSNPKIAANLDFISGARTITTASTDNLSIIPGGDLILAPAGLDVLPQSTMITNLGQQTRKWNTIYGAELYIENLVASSVLATIGGRVMVTNTNVLIADMTTGQTYIDVKYNDPAFTNWSFVILEDFVGGAAWVEVMRLTDNGTPITGGYRYNVERNKKAGGTARAWNAGVAVAWLGKSQHDGYIDLAAVRTVNDHLGPTVTITTRKADPSYTGNPAVDIISQTWNNVAPVVSMGNLNGFVDVGANNRFGIALGNDVSLTPAAGFSGIVADVTGLRLFNTDVILYEGASKVASFGEQSGVIFQYDSVTANNGSRGIYWTSGALPTLTDTSAVKSYRDVNGNHMTMQVFNAGAADLQLYAQNTSNTHSSSLFLTEDKMHIFVRDNFQVISSQNGRYSFGVTPGVNPASKMHLYEDTALNNATTGLTLENFNTNGDTMLHFVHANGATAHWNLGVDRSNSNRFTFAATADFTNAVMVLDPSTRFVGIGVTNPSNRLHVQLDQNNATIVRVQNDNTTATGLAEARFAAHVSATNYAHFGKMGSAANPLQIMNPSDAVIYNAILGDIAIVNNTPSGKIKMAARNTNIPDFVLDSSGNIGNGIASPTSALHVQRNITTSLAISGENLGTGATSRVDINAVNNLGHALQMQMLSSGYTASGIVRPDIAMLTASATDLVIRTVTANDIIFGTTNVEAARITSTNKLMVSVTTDSTPPTGAGGGGFQVNGNIGTVDGRAATIRATTGIWVSGNPEVIALGLDTFPSGSGFAQYAQIGIDFVPRAGSVVRPVALRATPGDIVLTSGRIAVGPSVTTPLGEIDVYQTGTGLWRGINSSQYTDDVNGPNLFFRKSRGVFGASTIVANGDALGHLRWYGYDGAAWREGARISALVNGAPGSNIMPTDLVFYTAGPTIVEEMRLTWDGKLGLGTSAPAGALDVRGASANTFIRVGYAAGNTYRMDLYVTPTYAAVNSYSDVTSVWQPLRLAGSEVQIWSNNVQKAVFDTSGFLGISNTSPGTYLHIGSGTPTLNANPGAWITGVGIANLNLMTTGGVQAGLMAHSNGNFYMGSWTDSPVVLRHNNADRVIIDGGATYSFDVVTNLRARSLIAAKAASSAGYVQMTAGSSTVAGWFGWYKPAADGAAAVRLAYMGNSATDIELRLENGANFGVTSGSLGVGTIAPGTVLTNTPVTGTLVHVKDLSTEAGVVVEGTSGTSFNLITRNGTANLRWLRYLTTIDGFSQWTAMNDNGTYRQYFVILDHANGYFGIGNVTPANTLDVGGTTALRNTVATTSQPYTWVHRRSRGTLTSPSALSSGDAVGGLGGFAYGTGGWQANPSAAISFQVAEAVTSATANAGGQILFYTRSLGAATNVALAMTLDPDGKPIIPAVFNYIGTGTAVLVTSTGQLVKQSSSLRHKTNIRDVPDDLIGKLILSLKPILYNSVYEVDAPDEIGFTAEQVEELGGYPYVNHNAEGQVESLHYDRLTVPLVMMAQKHEQEIAELNARIEALERRLAA